MINNYIEEKTPNGMTLKVLIKRWEFTAFNREGKAVYADQAGTKVLHKIPCLIILGKNIAIEQPSESQLFFLKIVKNEIIVPYRNIKENRRKYLFLSFEQDFLDQIPVRIMVIKDIHALVIETDTGLKPNFVVIDNSISGSEIQIIKSRHPSAEIINVEEKKETSLDNISESTEARASDLLDEKNLNVMSSNPVFLARVHLRRMDISKVNQLLLDFDISSLEAEYMLRFIDTILSGKSDSGEIKANIQKLESLSDSFKFYIALMNKKSDDIHMMIDNIDDMNKIASYGTLIAKVKLLFPREEDILVLTDYENLLFEKKYQLQNKA